MNISRPLHLRLISALLFVPVGCATAGTHRASQTSALSLKQEAALRAATEKPALKHAESPVETVTSLEAAERPKAQLIPAAYVDDTAFPPASRPPAADEPLVGDDGAAPAPAVPAGVAELTLESLEQLALANNPSIRQASAAAGEAMGIRTQVGLRPNPTVGYFGSQLGDAGTDQHGVFLNQDFVLGNKLALNTDVLGHDVQALLWEAEAQRYRVLTDIRRRFYDALASQRRLELASSFQEVARKGVRIAEDRMRALEGARPDVLQSEIQLNEVDLITQQARIDFEAAWRELAAVAGIPNMDPPTLVGTLEDVAIPRDMEIAYAELLGRSPELQAAYTRIQRARANLARQQAQPVPNLQAQLGFGHDTGTGSEFANVQLGLPIPVHNRNQGNICAAQAEYTRATEDARRLELNLRARLTQAMRDYDLANVTVSRYHNQILPMAGESLQLSEEAHAAGEFDFLRVLVARRTYFDANLNYVQALASLAKADAIIEGLQLSGGLADTVNFEGDDGLRGQALGGQ